MATVFSEHQVYRIDHYLGKETVQNVLAFRFANILFEPVWNRHYVDHVQITAAEAIGVEGRGAYYEEAGALRDMVQSHMLQLLSVVAMEPPPSSTATPSATRRSRSCARSCRRRRRGRAPGRAAANTRPGFIAGDEVAATGRRRASRRISQTETFVALKLEIDNWRWNGVPFYLRTGKRLPRRVTEIAIRSSRCRT